jgi:hypothetical protein
VTRDPKATGTRRLLHCDVCGRAVVVADDDLLRYAREGWPRCHGEVMAYFTESGRAAEADDDTVTDRPSPLPPA